jgi:putative heme-binding domain-containing protein
LTKETAEVKDLFRWLLLGGLALVLLGNLSGRAEKPQASALEPLVRVLLRTDDAELQRDVLSGMYEALQGRRHVKAPADWSAVYRKLSGSTQREVREKVLLLSLLFGDPEALTALRRTVRDARADAAERQRALQALIEAHVADLLPLLRDLLVDPVMRPPALRGMAACSDAGVPALVLRHYASYNEAEKADAIQTLSTRPAFAQALLDALEKGTVARRDISPYTARQLVALKDARVTERLNKLWGSIRPADKDKTRLLAHYKQVASPGALAGANLRHGREMFVKTCANCHTLFDAGGKIGPDLTGSQRRNPEYILTKVLDPNAVVARDYQVTVLSMSDGRTLSGLIKQENEQTLTLQTANEIIRLAKTDVEERHQSNVSMMPEGLLATLSEQEVRDLIAYLAGPGQVPLPGADPGKKKASSP